MDKKLKAKWVKALRSGEYKQGGGYLFSDGKYCCLGVLLHIEHPDHSYLEDSYAGSLPDSFQVQCGITPAQEDQLARMNDGKKLVAGSCVPGRKYGFVAIASYIEAHL
jgi:hypothetical protein